VSERGTSAARSIDWTFERPRRRPGIRVFNWLGRKARKRGWRHDLSVQEILDRARRQTGLEDWGEDYFLEPLRLLVEDFERRARLNSFGRWLVRQTLTGCVQNRLRVREYARIHPEAMQAPLRSPLIVVGMPRTGTTLLYNLLAQDPDARPLLGWESLWPAPMDPAGDKKDKRAGIGRRAAQGVDWLSPELRHIHPFHAEGPEECTWLMANTFVSPIYAMFGHVPSYQDWLWALDPADWARAYRDYADQLLVLQHQRNRGHWVLKSPVHFMSLQPLLDTLPEARVVVTDRDPREVVPSACSLFAVFRGISSDRVDRAELGEEILDTLARGHARVEAARAAHPDRLMKVWFRDLVKDKPGTVRRIYDGFGQPLGAETVSRIERWIAESPHSPSHRYGLEQFGLSEADVEARFGGHRPGTS
jgi:hypothetical protein